MAGSNAVLFDLDGTLVDNSGQPDVIRAVCRELAAMLGNVGPERVLEANGEAWREYWPTVAEAWTLGRLSTQALTSEAWRLTLSRCGCDDPALVRVARESHTRRAAASVRLYPHALELLESLRGRHAMGLVTNAAADRQRAILRQLDIERYFDSVGISGEIGVAKPDPAIFHRVANQIQVRPVDCWYVGDDPHTDVEGARLAGMTAVWLSRGGRPWPPDLQRPDHQLSSLADLPALLARS